MKRRSSVAPSAGPQRPNPAREGRLEARWASWSRLGERQGAVQEPRDAGCGRGAEALAVRSSPGAELVVVVSRNREWQSLREAGASLCAESHISERTSPLECRQQAPPELHFTLIQPACRRSFDLHASTTHRPSFPAGRAIAGALPAMNSDCLATVRLQRAACRPPQHQPAQGSRSQIGARLPIDRPPPATAAAAPPPPLCPPRRSRRCCCRPTLLARATRALSPPA